MQNTNLNNGRSTANKTNTWLWVVQGLLAALFLFAGVMKLAMPIDEMAKQAALPGAFLRFIGVAEVLGAAGLVIPSLLRIRPGLTPIAAIGLLVIMIGAIRLSAPMGALVVVPIATAALTMFVAYGRFWLSPVTSHR